MRRKLNRLAGLPYAHLWSAHLPSGGLEEVGLAIHQLRSELGHLLLHFAHLTVEAVADAREFRVDNAEVAQFDRDVALVLGHCV